MIQVAVFLLAASNIILLLLVFSLMVRPIYFIPLIRRWLVFEHMDIEDEQVYRLCEKTRWLGVLFLFCWSFCCSVLVCYTKIFLV